MEQKKYEAYSNIKIESLTRFWGYSRNKATYNRIKSNGVDTLEDLFIKYDNDSLVFPEFDKDANATARAIIELIRFQYLKADLLIDVYLSKVISPFSITRNDSTSFTKVFTVLRAVGLEKRQASSVTHYISRNLKEPKSLGEIITDIYRKNIRVGSIGINELEDLRIKFSLLVEYYNSKKELITPPKVKSPIQEQINPVVDDMIIKSLEEEEQELLRRRANLDKKIAVVQEKLALLRATKEGKTL